MAQLPLVAFLESISLVQYAAVFDEAGYEDIQSVSQSGRQSVNQ